jgi:hypothetical protein
MGDPKGAEQPQNTAQMSFGSENDILKYCNYTFSFEDVY